MAHCQFCFPWNKPLALHSHRSADGVTVPMAYQEWLWYELHVAQHQAGHWAGELDPIASVFPDIMPNLPIASPTVSV